MTEISSEELLKEKSLYEVYVASRRMPVSRLNQVGTAVVMALVSVFCWLSPDTYHLIAERVRTLSDYGFQFSTSILSFLIAGFTIYLTVTKTDLLIAMASHRHQQTGLPWVKYLSFAFLRIMIVYVAYCLYCIGIKILASPGGLIPIVLAQVAQAETVKLWVARIGFVMLSGATVHLVFLLQSFIFNIYHVSLTMLCVEREMRGQANTDRVEH